MNEQKIFSLIVYFNKRNGKRHQASSESLQNMFKVAIQNFGEETVEEIIKNVKSDSIYKVLDLMFIEEYVKNKAPKEVETKVEVKDGVEIRYIEKIKIVEVDRIVEVPKIIEVIKEVATPSMTLGILEEAMATVLTEKYVPVIAKQVNEQVDNYVKATYGPVKQEVIFAHNGKVLEGEIFHNEFETVMNFVLADEPLMLVGPAGSGKNVICKQVADLLDTEFYFTNAVTQEHKLTGYKDAMGKYHETEFYKAFTKGGLFMLDEIDASIPEVLVILNAAIANRYFDFPTGKVNAHPDFRIISAGNTFGHGASYQYVGRNQLDGASLNRFAVLEMGIVNK